jgi:hypothetical protein
MTIKSNRGGNHGGGRPPKSLQDRAAFRGKVAIRINVEAALQLQSLMLQQTEGIHTPEQMVEWLIRQEAQRRA